MDKFVEINLIHQIDRYKITGITVDDFIDVIVETVGAEAIKDISEEEYERAKEYAVGFSVEDKFTIEHYTYHYASPEAKKLWRDFVRELRKNRHLNSLE